MSIPATNITLTGTFIDAQGNPVNGGTVTATLQGYGGAVPMIAGSAMLETVAESTTLTGTNTFSMALYGNDQISPGGTFWAVKFPGPGGNSVTQNYLLTGVGSFDLSNLTPLNQPPTPQALPGQTLVQPFTAVAHKFLTGMTSAGALIAAQPAASDLSNGVTGSGNVVLATSPTLVTPTLGVATGTSLTLTGTITSYNGTSTISNGVPALVAKADLTAQAANVGSTLLYAVPASGAGFYRVSFYLVVTQAATVSSTLPNGQISFTDNDTGIAGLGPYLITGTNTGNTVGASNSVPALPAAESAILDCKASTNINYSTNNYASSGATPMQYAIHVRLEYLGS